jgi:hypothetical protein
MHSRRHLADRSPSIARRRRIFLHVAAALVGLSVQPQVVGAQSQQGRSATGSPIRPPLTVTTREWLQLSPADESAHIGAFVRYADALRARAQDPNYEGSATRARRDTVRFMANYAVVLSTMRLPSAPSGPSTFGAEVREYARAAIRCGEPAEMSTALDGYLADRAIRVLAQSREGTVSAGDHVHAEEIRKVIAAEFTGRAPAARRDFGMRADTAGIGGGADLTPLNFLGCRRARQAEIHHRVIAGAAETFRDVFQRPGRTDTSRFVLTMLPLLMKDSIATWSRKGSPREPRLVIEFRNEVELALKRQPVPKIEQIFISYAWGRAQALLKHVDRNIATMDATQRERAVQHALFDEAADRTQAMIDDARAALDVEKSRLDAKRRDFWRDIRRSAVRLADGRLVFLGEGGPFYIGSTDPTDFPPKLEGADFRALMAALRQIAVTVDNRPVIFGMAYREGRGQRVAYYFVNPTRPTYAWTIVGVVKSC